MRTTGSTTKERRRFPRPAATEESSGASSTIPKVEPADRAEGAGRIEAHENDETEPEGVQGRAAPVGDEGQQRRRGHDRRPQSRHRHADASHVGGEKQGRDYGGGPAPEARKTQELGHEHGDEGQMGPRYGHEMGEPYGLERGVAVRKLQRAAIAADEGLYEGAPTTPVLRHRRNGPLAQGAQGRRLPFPFPSG